MDWIPNWQELHMEGGWSIEVAHGGGAGVLKLHMEGRVGIEVAHRGGLEY